jgi:glycosyltransferase involved in cell wall biosynthesis
MNSTISRDLINDSNIELTILMPCLNEARTVGKCIEKAKKFLQTAEVTAEILIADNGSTDGSQSIARDMGARVVNISQRGYGSALRGGIEAAQGKYIIMGDADDSYDFLDLMPFLSKLRDGYDLVMGNRFLGGIKQGAMPPLHQYIGNPILSGVGQLFFNTPIKDFHCGLRGTTKEAAKRMDLQTTGMEFASEMVIKSALLEMRVCEIPIVLYPDGRDRPPHLRSWRDGWRHLRFMLIYSPRWLFFYPGVFLVIFGLVLSLWAFLSPITINDVTFDIHSLAYFNAMVVIGFTMILFAIQSRYYAFQSGLIPQSPGFGFLYKFFSLERGLLFGVLLVLIGVFLAIWAFRSWAQAQFGDINPRSTMRIVLPSISIIIMGTQVMFSSFFLLILGIPTSKSIENSVNRK